MINRLSLFAAVFSTALCLFILIATLWVWTKKHARPMLDRISFRLFWWTMGFELAYDVAYIVGEAYVSLRSSSPLDSICSLKLIYLDGHGLHCSIVFRWHLPPHGNHGRVSRCLDSTA